MVENIGILLFKKSYNYYFLIDKILEREEKIDLLVHKTQTMTNLSTDMKKQVKIFKIYFFFHLIIF